MLMKIEESVEKYVKPNKSSIVNSPTCQAKREGKADVSSQITSLEIKKSLRLGFESLLNTSLSFICEVHSILQKKKRLWKILMFIMSNENKLVIQWLNSRQLARKLASICKIIRLKFLLMKLTWIQDLFEIHLWSIRTKLNISKPLKLRR